MNFVHRVLVTGNIVLRTQVFNCHLTDLPTLLLSNKKTRINSIVKNLNHKLIILLVTSLEKVNVQN